MAKKKIKTINDWIEEIMGEAFLKPLFFLYGINALKEKVEGMDDKDVCALFMNNLSAKSIRTELDRIHKILNDNNLLYQ